MIRCTGRPEVGEELTADAFLELHRHWLSIDTEMLPSWLFKVVKNRAADYWRRVELERKHSVSEPEAIEPPSLTGMAELFEHIRLRPLHRTCITLRYVHEMSLTEIAGCLGLSEIQVKGNLQYARSLIRKQLCAAAGHRHTGRRETTMVQSLVRHSKVPGSAHF